MHYPTIINHCLRSIIILDIIIVLVLLIVFAAARSLDANIYSVQSGSMAPVLDVGDAVIVYTESLNSLRPGEIISYRKHLDPSIIVTHRIVSIDKTSDQLLVAGDGNRANDLPINQSDVVGRVVAVLPGLGYLIDSLRQPWSIALLIYLPSGFLIIQEAKRVVKHLSRPSYQLYSR